MYMVETSIWISKSRHRTHSMLVYFRTLALLTGVAGSCPLANIWVDVWPYEMSNQQFLCSSDSRIWKECNESKMALRNLKGTYGWDVLIDTSHSNVTSVVVAGIGLSDKEQLSCVSSCSWEFCCCAAASYLKSISGNWDGEVTKFNLMHESASATGLLCPPMWWISLVNCEI